jgi:hypothetical protein
MTTPTENISIDAVDAFLLYHLFNGNAMLTALALEADEEAVTALATSGAWDGKLKDCNRLPSDNANDPKDLMRYRLNAIQLARVQSFVDEILISLEGIDSPEPLYMSRTKSGTAFNTRSLAELTEIGLTLQNLSRQLNDEHEIYGVPRGKPTGADITACFAKAMAVADSFGFDAIKLLQKVLGAQTATTAK